MKIGIYGGSFNPVHNGHLKVAEWILDKVKLDKIIWVPLYKPYHKEIIDLEEPEHRYNMLKLALKNKKKYEISRVEIDDKIISYTLDTLLKLRNQYPGNEFYEIIGGDSAETFQTWKDYKEILENAKVLVYSRRGHEVKITENMELIEAPYLDISSTLIREKVENGESISGLVPKTVEEYIYNNKLYR
jgi:nicotinate-nucleotide adenylyltransferase